MRNLVLIFVACLVAALINPNTFHLYGYTIQPQFSGVQQSFIAEWQSPNFHVLEERGFELMLLLLPIAFTLRRPSLWDVCLTAAVTYLALSAVRHSALFVAAETPLLIWSFSAGWERMALAERSRLDRPTCQGGARRCRRGSAVAVLGTAHFVHGTLSNQARATAANFPVGAADWLEAHPNIGTHMFDQYGWGGYLIHRFYPQPNRRVFSFGEATLLGNKVMQQVADVETGIRTGSRSSRSGTSTTWSTCRVPQRCSRWRSTRSGPRSTTPGWP